MKIIGVGLNKTGTTTLEECGKILGYRCARNDKRLLEDVKLGGDFTRVFQVMDAHDLFQDWPWPLIYKEIDARYPGSKFILTHRKREDSWLASIRKHATRINPRKNCRHLVYGHPYPEGFEEAYLKFYRDHNASVRAYFKDRPGDLLEVCWEDGDGWEKICPFLGHPIPDHAFPHAGSAKTWTATRWHWRLENRIRARLAMGIRGRGFAGSGS